MMRWFDVLVPTPFHSHIGGALTYSFDEQDESRLVAGHLVRVPLGHRELLGIVWRCHEMPPDGMPDQSKIRAISGRIENLGALSTSWLTLIQFSAHYYQRALGEVALAALPPSLRDLSNEQLQRRLRRPSQRPNSIKSAAAEAHEPLREHSPITLTNEQSISLAQIDSGEGPFLLYGSTGSGKTEVYMQAVAQQLLSDPDAQVLVMVPEINLTPQLQTRFTARFGTDFVVSMHSGMTPAQRLQSWLAAHTGQARVILGTRLAVFASMPKLRLIVVDEEHDPSYKAQDGARHSARDLAVYRAQLENAKVILGSATPSLESWLRSTPTVPVANPAVLSQQPKRPSAHIGRYQRLCMPSRIGSAALPAVRLVDMTQQPKGTVLASSLLEAIQIRIARNEQVLILMNRRGYAPVLHCTSCDWRSSCPHCSAFRVFHKIDRTLRCHHCGLTDRVPRACPDCGNLDIGWIGRGTQRLEEHLTELLADVRRPDGGALHILRIDADSTRHTGELERQLAQVHSGEVNVLVGTQMIAKGHDFRRITLVAAVNPDGALFSSDFRAPERLFSLLMQAGGRAGRDSAFAESSASEMWVQTSNVHHPLFAALKAHDYPAFAQQQLKEREQAGLPPYSFQALLRAEAKTQEAAQAYLMLVSELGQSLSHAMDVTIYPCVPMNVQRIANIERAQMLVESSSRPALQRFLTEWHQILHDNRHKNIIRWAVDVDPISI